MFFPHKQLVPDVGPHTLTLIYRWRMKPSRSLFFFLSLSHHLHISHFHGKTSLASFACLISAPGSISFSSFPAALSHPPPTSLFLAAPPPPPRHQPLLPYCLGPKPALPCMLASASRILHQSGTGSAARETEGKERAAFVCQRLQTAAWLPLIHRLS